MNVGIWGEHGRLPASIRFCHTIGLIFVSCSGPRFPIACLAAKQAAILESKKMTDTAAA